MSAPLIRFENVVKELAGQRILDGIDLHIPKGKTTTVIGKSGTGKSVLLKHIVGLLTPDSGEILLEDRPLSRMRKADLDAWRAKSSYMFQQMALFDSMTVFENVALPLRYATRLGKEEIGNRVSEKLKQLDLVNVDHKYPGELSGGMKKRVAMARALITEPEIILFDEPTTGLDPIRKNAVHSMIAEYQRKMGFTIVMISHEIPDVFYISQHLIMLDKGGIVFEGSPDAIEESRNPTVAEFVKGMETPTDSLTGLGTQAQGVKRFQEELHRLHHHAIAFSVIFLTLENMDEINQSLGYFGGQQVLKQVADQVRRHIRLTDACTRHGMNQLMIMLQSTPADGARTFCTKLSKTMHRDAVLPENAPADLKVVLSAGFEEAERDRSFMEVMNRATSRDEAFMEFTVD